MTVHINRFARSILRMTWNSDNIAEFAADNLNMTITDTDITLVGNSGPNVDTVYEIYSVNTHAIPCTNNLDTD